MRELQRRGVVRIPKQDTLIPTDQNGFVEFGNDSKQIKPKTTSPTKTNTEFFGFMDSSSTTPTQDTEFSTQTDGYNKREVDEKISELDNKIYKLENRIELIEKNSTSVSRPIHQSEPWAGNI